MEVARKRLVEHSLTTETATLIRQTFRDFARVTILLLVKRSCDDDLSTRSYFSERNSVSFPEKYSV